MSVRSRNTSAATWLMPCGPTQHDRLGQECMMQYLSSPVSYTRKLIISAGLTLALAGPALSLGGGAGGAAGGAAGAAGGAAMGEMPLGAADGRRRCSRMGLQQAQLEPPQERQAARRARLGMQPAARSVQQAMQPILPWGSAAWVARSDWATLACHRARVQGAQGAPQGDPDHVSGRG